MAKKRVGRYPNGFRRMAVERLKSCENIVALSEELGVHRRRSECDDSGCVVCHPEVIRRVHGKTALKFEKLSHRGQL